MIEKIEVYQVKCDRCGVIMLDGNEDPAVFKTEQDAKDALTQVDMDAWDYWVDKDGKCYCYNCTEIKRKEENVSEPEIKKTQEDTK
jgi:hypothetical protein